MGVRCLSHVGTEGYVLDRRLPNYNFILSEYKVDTSTGAWTLVGSIPDLTNVSLDPQGHFLVAKPLGEYDCCCDYCSRPKTLVTYGIDPLTGVLSSPSMKVLFQGAGAEIVTIHPSSRFLLVRGETPRLCRGGSRSLTFSGVRPQDSLP